MKTIIISPYSQKMRNNKRNPKDYPWWQEVVTKLKEQSYKVIQVGVSGEKRLDNVDDFLTNKSLNELKGLITMADHCISIDNFFPHLCNLVGKRIIVLWGRSDPKIFGYERNINLLKSKDYLRWNQFDIWEACEYDETVFVNPDLVISALNGDLAIQKIR